MNLNKLFCAAFIIIIVVIPIVIFIRPAKTVSVSENRSLTTFNFNENFWDNSLQKNIESALLDQMVFGATIKKTVSKYKNIIVENSSYFIFKNKPKNYLIPLGNGGNGGININLLNKSDYLVYEPLTSFNSIKSDVSEYVKIINKIDDNYDVQTYVFYINKDADINIYNNFNRFMESNLNTTIKYDYLKELVDENYYDNFKKYFYKSDHHWNYNGQYVGYKDIMHLLGKEYYVYKSEHCFANVKFSGSKAKKIGSLKYYDNFCTYEYDLPEHSTYVNGIEMNYGDKLEYYENKFNNNISYNHYAKFFGDDVGEVKYVFPNNTGNILIIGNSYTNPINELIASAFNQTFVVDMRAYEEDIGIPFNVDKYIKDHNIDKVLFIGDYNFYASKVFRFNVD